MALDDWLLEDETLIFSAYDSYSKEEVVVTDKRLIFYCSGIAREEIDSYNLNQIAGYAIKTVRNISQAIAGAKLIILGIIFFYAIAPLERDILVMSHMKVIIFFFSMFLVIIGFTLIVGGLLVNQTIELTIAGKTITKKLKLPRKQLIELSKALHLVKTQY